MRVDMQGGHPVVSPGERIDISNSEELKQVLLSLFQQGHQFITLDFEGVDMIDSSGVGKLLLFQKKLRESGGQLKIKNVTSGKIQKLFNILHLEKAITIE